MEVNLTRKLAWFLLAVFVGVVVFITLGATNYANIGTITGGFLQSSFLMPIRDTIVNAWLAIGTSGWYILAASLGLMVFGGVFMVGIVYGVVWKKHIKPRTPWKETETSVPLASMQRTTSTSLTPPAQQTPTTEIPAKPEEETASS